jgi:hypothetical protein
LRSAVLWDALVIGVAEALGLLAGPLEQAATINASTPAMPTMRRRYMVRSSPSNWLAWHAAARLGLAARAG